MNKDLIIAKQREALNKIANPIAWMQNDAEKKGLRLDGNWAIQIASDYNWYRAVAKDCLSELVELEQDTSLAKAFQDMNKAKDELFEAIDIICKDYKKT